MSLQGQKHSIKCRCILPQFKKREKPVFHEFIVFSLVIDGNVQESFAQCNNCGIAHRVYDFCKSEILKSKENLRSLPTVSDISMSLPNDVVDLLKTYNADIATFQEVAFLVENSVYDKKILLEKEEAEGYVVGKFLSFLKNGRFKVEPFSYQVEIKRDG